MQPALSIHLDTLSPHKSGLLESLQPAHEMGKKDPLLTPNQRKLPPQISQPPAKTQTLQPRLLASFEWQWVDLRNRCTQKLLTNALRAHHQGIDFLATEFLAVCPSPGPQYHRLSTALPTIPDKLSDSNTRQS